MFLDFYSLKLLDRLQRLLLRNVLRIEREKEIVWEIQRAHKINWITSNISKCLQLQLQFQKVYSSHQFCIDLSRCHAKLFELHQILYRSVFVKHGKPQWNFQIGSICLHQNVIHYYFAAAVNICSVAKSSFDYINANESASFNIKLAAIWTNRHETAVGQVKTLFRILT